MNELPIDEAMADKIVDEANAACGMNMKMFMELEPTFRRYSIGFNFKEIQNCQNLK